MRACPGITEEETFVSPFARAVTYWTLRSDGHADLLQQEKSKISMESNLELFRYILSSSGAIFVIMVSKEELRERPLIYLCLKHCSQYFTTTILFNTLKITPSSSNKLNLGICKWAIHYYDSSRVTERSAACLIFNDTDKGVWIALQGLCVRVSTGQWVHLANLLTSTPLHVFVFFSHHSEFL